MAGQDYSMAAMILAIIGGVSLLIGGLLLIMAMSVISQMDPYGIVTGALWVVIIMGILSGVMVIVGGIMIKSPSKRMIGSILAIVFGVVGFFGGGGLLLTGTILSVIAGILGLMSKG